MKKEMRLLGIDDAGFDKNLDKQTWVIGTIFRGGEFMDGVMTTKIKVDGQDATDKIIHMINKSKFKTQLRAILLDGIAVGGFNIIDIKKLNQKLNIGIIVIMRNYPDIDKIKKALQKLGMKNKQAMLDRAGPVHSYKKIYYQSVGFDAHQAESIISLSCTHSDIPEPIRIAHLIGSAIAFGESKGRA